MQVARDPFARGEYVRETWLNRKYGAIGGLRCQWCGQQPARLYTYTWQSDDSHSSWRSRELFCNLACRTAYR